MRNTYLVILILAILTSCKTNDGPKVEDYTKLQKELADCKKTVEELSNTPQLRLINGQQFFAKNDFASARKELNGLIEKYPVSEEAKKATMLLSDIEKIETERKEAEERKRTLGYKALKESNTLLIGDVTIKFNSISIGGQWIFDNYGTEWRYRSAERGEIYVLSKISISAETKDPNLPPILVFKISNGALSLLGTMGYEFSRWENYGTYLGNNADFSNDFAHTKTIPFSCGLSISKNDIDNEAVFVVVKKANCFSRAENKYANPPVSYTEGECNVKSSLSIDDFDNDYVLIKIFNKAKL
jgi:hypothetical protein